LTEVNEIEMEESKATDVLTSDAFSYPD